MARLNELAREGLAISVISLAELYEGVFFARDPERSELALTQFLDPELAILGIDDMTCRIFGRERGRLRIEGQMISDFDLMIAATALRHNVTLLTNNRKHFERIPGLRIISV